MNHFNEETFPSSYPPGHPFSKPRKPGKVPEPDFGPNNPIEIRPPKLPVPSFDPSPFFDDPSKTYPWYPFGKGGPVLYLPWWLNPAINPLIPNNPLLPSDIPVGEDDNPFGFPIDIPIDWGKIFRWLLRNPDSNPDFPWDDPDVNPFYPFNPSNPEHVDPLGDHDDDGTPNYLDPQNPYYFPPGDPDNPPPEPPGGDPQAPLPMGQAINYDSLDPRMYDTNFVQMDDPRDNFVVPSTEGELARRAAQSMSRQNKNGMMRGGY